LRRARNKTRAGKHEPTGQVKSDINVTPLVDVVLVLLIIFMVVTPIIAGGVRVELPRTAYHNRKADDGKDIIISVTADKRVFLAGRLLSGPTDLTRLIEDERRKHPEKTAFVKGDSRTPYGTVRAVMEAVKKGGLDDVQLGTDDIKNDIKEDQKK
jgi:biopolymer transport protein ExbD/biopolymer transport protein TolR